MKKFLVAFYQCFSEGLTDRGFLLAEKPIHFEEEDENGNIKAGTNLVCPPAVGVPCISITSIPQNVHTVADGPHHDTYFAYTFYAKYIVDSEEADAQEPEDYTWDLKLNYEKTNENDADISKAVWAMVFESDVQRVENGSEVTFVDGPATMTFYAEIGADGEKEYLPELSVTDMAYTELPVQQFAKDASQFQLVHEGEYFNYYRLAPYDFPSEDIAATGHRENVQPNDIHKYTVVLWLEGDDPECTDDLMGAAIGMNFLIRLDEEESVNPDPTAPSTEETVPED